MSFAQLATALRLADRLDHAERAWQIAFDVTPPHLEGDLLRRRAWLRFRRGRLADALRDAKAALDLTSGQGPMTLEGMKSAATIIAINTDENAPIFNFAHYGMTEDLFDVCEELTEALKDR